MLIKELYTLPDQARDLIEMPDGSLYTFLVVPGRALKMSDLDPVTSPLPPDIYLQAAHAKPYDMPLRSLQFKAFGLTDVPLKEYRRRAGMAQQELADKAGVNIRQIQKLESGENKIENTTLTNALRLADALGVDVRELI